MRASTVVVVSVLLGAFACSRFGEDTPPSDDPTADDAGTKKKDAATTSPPVVVDAGTDPSPLPANAFDDVAAYDHSDDFNRADAPGDGPLKWSEQGNTDDIGTADCEQGAPCQSPIFFSQNTGTDSGYLETKLDSDTDILRFDFTLKIEADKQIATSHVQLASIELDGDRFFFLELLGGALRLGDQYKVGGEADYRSEFTDVGSVTFNTWEHYRLYVNFELGLISVARENVPLVPFRVVRPESRGKPEKARLGVTFFENDTFFLQFDDVGVKEWKN